MLKNKRRALKLSLFLIFCLIFLFKISNSNFKKDSNLQATTFILKENQNFYFQDFLSFSSFVFVYFPSQNLTPKTLATLQENKEIFEYTVQQGDTISSISQKFNISPETILWVNNLKSSSKIKPGQKLIILPVSGLIHLVEQGETLEKIAKKYKANLKEILEFNEISANEILPGDILIIPNGTLPKVEKKIFSQMAFSDFICPILPPCKITQGWHFFNAVDLSNGKEGGPVLAAKEGVVQKIGFDRIAGNFIRLLHKNGVITFYGHLSEILVSPGQNVSQGEIIGKIGQTGRATGPHLHFEVRGAKNPFIP